MKQKLTEKIIEVLKKLGLADSVAPDFSIEYPADLKFGDYSANVAMVLAKKQGSNPSELAEKIAMAFQKEILDTGEMSEIDRVQIAGPGFINFYLSDEFVANKISEIFSTGNHYGRGKMFAGKKMIIDYTDPNVLKQFHIGHLMSNAIGESIARLFEWNGAEVFRLCYQGDVGMHVAKAVWGMIQNKEGFPQDTDDLEDKMKFIGEAYAYGADKYETDENAKAEMNDINKKVFNFFNGDPNDDDQEIKIYYEKGKQWSLKHFDEIYEKLGTKFDRFIFESTTSVLGEKIVRENVPNVFELSDGAVVYKGEKDGLHTRVFINSQGLPTYEAKDIGLAHTKEKIDDFDVSIVITANEQKEYFKVVKTALSKFAPEIAEKTLHIMHGMMRLDSGKMSSRKGNVITGESLLLEAEHSVHQIIADRNFDSDEMNQVAIDVAVAAIKYSVLKQATGRDIVYDPNIALNFEGDSGPYLQYTATRAKSVVKKALDQGISIDENNFPADWKLTVLERMLLRFPEIVSDAGIKLSPHLVTNYLIQVAGEFNSFYGNNQIIDNTAAMSYKLALTRAVQFVLENGLQILGIRIPERM